MGCLNGLFGNNNNGCCEWIIGIIVLIILINML